MTLWNRTKKSKDPYLKPASAVMVSKELIFHDTISTACKRYIDIPLVLGVQVDQSGLNQAPSVLSSKIFSFPDDGVRCL
jgi:hypothetical protein